MSGSSQLSAPGSSSYQSNTLHVGDGTWVAGGRDDFLLPNLVGLNFATMQYNGELPGKEPPRRRLTSLRNGE